MRCRSIIRACALVVLGMMMLVRMGPLCETMAMAPAPATSHGAMADCDSPGDPRGTQRDAALGACAGACLAMEADRQFAATTPMVTPVMPAAATYPALEGRADRPMPPPPRMA